jgi:hypothetical protein
MGTQLLICFSRQAARARRKESWLRTGMSLPSSTKLPFETYKTFCPYLVGDYETISNELTLYVVAG